MVALLVNRDTDEAALVQEVSLLALPVAANTTIFSGSLVATDAAGNAVPASALSSLRVWGRADKQIVNTVAAGFGTAGALTIEVQCGVFMFVNGDGITNANIGQLCYALDDQTVTLASGSVANGRPVAGVIYGLTGTQVRVGVGPLFAAPFANNADPVGILPAFAAGTISLAVGAAVNDAVYDVPATAVASTITLPATAPVGTRLVFCADGTKNTQTVQFLDGNGAAALTAALVAAKRFCVIAVKTTATAWTATGNSSP
jgi:hypothetical protein